MAKRSKQLDTEIAAALAKGAPHPEATPADWKKRVTAIQKRAGATHDPAERTILQQELNAANDGLRAAQSTAAMKPTYVTDTNLFALTQLVVKHGGPTFPNRLERVDHPHIKRTLEAGLIEPVGNKLRLTTAGREVVADKLVQDIARESNWRPRENTFVPVEKRAEILARDVAEHTAKVQRLEDALAKIR